MLIADRLQHARVGRVPRLAPALGRQPQLREQDLAELLRRGDQELLPGERVDRLLQRGDLRAHPLGDLGQALEVEPHPQQLHLAQDGHERQLDLSHQRLETEL